ncbi:MAG: hypothetical protein HOI95_23445 [Chromatiales bacterium]|nr:hypothetical protein [Chromatiales bacterium]
MTKGLTINGDALPACTGARVPAYASTKTPLRRAHRIWANTGRDLNGQIYFIEYGFADASTAATYTQSPDDKVSEQVYTELTVPATPTWDNCIRDILPQYGKLYPS